MKINIEAKGLNEFMEMLMNPKKKLAFQKTVVKYSGDLQKAAIRKVPVRTGHLKRSIQPPTFSEDVFTGTVVATAEYAYWVEKGTRFMAAQPFMEPAFNEIRQEFLNAVQKVVNS